MNEGYKRISELVKGIELLEELDPNGLWFIECYQFTFRKLMLEDGSIERFPEILRFHLDQVLAYLHQKNYHTVEEPMHGDIVLYFIKDGGPGILEHTGVYDRNGKVISKWGKGPVIRHNIETVPTIYGNKVEFWRR